MPKVACIGRLNAKMSDNVAFKDDATINDVLAHFDITLKKGESLAIDGTPVDGETEFENHAEIFIVPSTTGGI